MTYSKLKKMAEMGPTRTAQHCAQCAAHGQISLLKGHKKACPYKECKCVQCVLVNNKRQIMAKQVKLKRLQEKNHAMKHLERSSSEGKRSSRVKRGRQTSQEENPGGSAKFELKPYQDAWHPMYCQNSNIEPMFVEHPSPVVMPSSEMWSQVNPMHFAHIGSLQQLHNPASSLILQPCFPATSATALGVFASPLNDAEELNHVFTQPVYYPSAQINRVPSPTQMCQLIEPSNESFLQPLEVASFTRPANIAAAETLLTLRTGEE